MRTTCPVQQPALFSDPQGASPAKPPGTGRSPASPGRPWPTGVLRLLDRTTNAGTPTAVRSLRGDAPVGVGRDPVMVAMLPQRSRARVAPPSCPGGRPGEPASSDRPGRRRGGHQQSRRCKAIGHRFRSSMQTRSIAEASMRRGWASWPGSRRPDSMNIMRRRQNNVRGKASCGRRRVIEAGEQETRTVRGRLRSLSGPISSSNSWLGQRPPMSGG